MMNLWMMWENLQQRMKDQTGSVLGEYGLWIALIVVVAAAVLSPIGAELASIFTDLCTRLNSGAACP